MILARYLPGAFRHDGAFEQEFIFAAPAAIQIRRRPCTMSMSQLTRSPSYGPAADTVRGRNGPTLTERRELIEMWAAERNSFAERQVKDMKSRK